MDIPAFTSRMHRIADVEVCQTEYVPTRGNERRRGRKAVSYEACFTTIKLFNKKRLTAAQFAMKANINYESARRFIKQGQRAKVLKPCGFGFATRGPKPILFTLDLDQ